MFQTDSVQIFMIVFIRIKEAVDLFRVLQSFGQLSAFPFSNITLSNLSKLIMRILDLESAEDSVVQFDASCVGVIDSVICGGDSVIHGVVDSVISGVGSVFTKVDCVVKKESIASGVDSVSGGWIEISRRMAGFKLCEQYSNTLNLARSEHEEGKSNSLAGLDMEKDVVEQRNVNHYMDGMRFKLREKRRVTSDVTRSKQEKEMSNSLAVFDDEKGVEQSSVIWDMARSHERAESNRLAGLKLKLKQQSCGTSNLAGEEQEGMEFNSLVRLEKKTNDMELDKLKTTSVESQISSTYLKQTGRRGGWNIIGGLSGGAPDPVEVKKPLFANSDSNESEDSDAGTNLFADSCGSSSGTEEEEDESRNVVVETDKVSCSIALSTIYATNKDDSKSCPVPLLLHSKCDCNNKCEEAIINMEAAAKEDLKTRFEGLSLMERKNILLQHLRAQKDITGNVIDGFSYGGHVWCNSAFSKLTGISRYILRKMQEAHMQGMDKMVHANSLISKNSPRKVQAMCWFKAFCKVYGQRAPDDILVILPSFLNVTTVFNMYKEENPIEAEQIKFSAFCDMVKNDFGPKRKSRSLPRVRFSKFSSHSVCSTCSDLDAFQRTCRSQADIDLCQALKFKHKERFSAQQRCITSMRLLSQTLPDQYFSIFIDGMDNQKSLIPHFKEKTKNLANFYKLQSKITGCILYSSHYPTNRKVKMFINFDQYEQGKTNFGYLRGLNVQ